MPTHQRPSRATTIAAALALLLGGAALVVPAASAAQVHAGAGSYTTDNVGAIPGAECGQHSLRDHLTADAPTTPVPTNDWWTSLVFKFDVAGDSVDSCTTPLPLNALPVQYSMQPTGVHLSYEPTALVESVPSHAPGDQRFHHYHHQGIVVATVAGMTTATTKVSGWSDWTVSTRLSDGTRTLDATIGEGLPFSWYRASGGNAKVRLEPWTERTEWLNEPGRKGFTIGPAGDDDPVKKHNYIAFAPVGTQWAASAEANDWNSYVATGPGAFSIIALPDGLSESVLTALANQVTPFAHSPVTDSRVDYTFDEARSTVTATYLVTANPLPGSGGTAGTVMALLPHQNAKLANAKRSDGTDAAHLATTYGSPRGPMTAVIGATEFTTSDTFHGMLTEVPAVATGTGADRTTLEQLLDAHVSDAPLAASLRQESTPTYGVGKALGRTARLVEVADQLNKTTLRDKFVGDLRDVLTDWFTATPGKTTQVFRYSSEWSSLIGYPADFFADTELNDHHFHYGYYLAAAATLARFDPQWAQQYGPMVEMLIRDVNSPDRNDPLFPHLRYFDPYSGHDYAAGPAPYDAGNNQESSSEAMNFQSALIQWGEVTGNRALRDAGIYMFTTQAEAINQYWFNSSGQGLPPGYDDAIVPVLWTNGGTGGLFFGDGEKEFKYGINSLPVTGGFLYLEPASAQRNYDALRASLAGGVPGQWQDILYGSLALADAPQAWALWRPLLGTHGYMPEYGSTDAHTLHWIANLARLGTVDRTVSANYPMATVFIGPSGDRTYVVSNVSGAPITVTFSDCTEVTAARGKVVAAGASSWSGGTATGGAGIALPSATWPGCAVDPPDPDEGDPGSGDPGDDGPGDGGPGAPNPDDGGTNVPTDPAGPGAGADSPKLTKKQRAVLVKAKITRGKSAKKRFRTRTRVVIKVRLKAPKHAKAKGRVTLRVKKKVLGKAKLRRIGKRKYVATVKIRPGKNRKVGRVKATYSGSAQLREATYRTPVRAVR